MHDASGHHHVDGQALLQPLGRTEAAFFDATPALERAVIDLDHLPLCVPVELLAGLVEVGNVHRGEQHTLERLGASRRALLAGVYHPQPDRPQCPLPWGGRSSTSQKRTDSLAVRVRLPGRGGTVICSKPVARRALATVGANRPQGAPFNGIQRFDHR